MILLTENCILQDSKKETIEKVEVWYKTILGITPSLREAISICTNYEIDPEIGIVPVVVYSSASMSEMFTKKGE